MSHLENPVARVVTDILVKIFPTSQAHGSTRLLRELLNFFEPDIAGVDFINNSDKSTRIYWRVQTTKPHRDKN